MPQTPLRYVPISPLIDESAKMQAFLDALAALLPDRLTTDHAKLCIRRLLEFCGRSRPDGRLGPTSAARLAEAAGWALGEPGDFYAACLSAGWLEEDAEGLYVEGWERHGGRAIEKRRSWAEQKARQRRQGNVSAVVPPATGQAPDRLVNCKQWQGATELSPSSSASSTRYGGECPPGLKEKCKTKKKLEMKAKEHQSTAATIAANGPVSSQAIENAQKPRGQEVPVSPSFARKTTTYTKSAANHLRCQPPLTEVAPLREVVSTRVSNGSPSRVAQVWSRGLQVLLAGQMDTCLGD